ncbi:MAG TPA: FG-GAP-like repeat-containing protein [Pyrinomonadaceae bacterium]|nr:FG-GAP-like repeat-containing protein [Pyrinomonadaceae bacterium]
MKNFRCLVFVLLFSALGVSAQQRFVAALDGVQEVPTNFSAGKGKCTIVLNAAQTQITVNCTFSGLGTAANAAHIHGNGGPGVTAPVLFGFTGVPAATSGTIGPLNFAVTPTQVADMRAHRHYVNIHSVNLPNGEIRGQIKQANTILDSDGDGRTDATTFRQSTNTFWVRNSLTGEFRTYTLGTGAGDIFLNNSADFDGDGRGDMLLIKLDANSQATWSILQSGTNTVRNVFWGAFTVAAGDTLAMADYDGDGTEDVAVFRRSTGDWWYIESSTGLAKVEHWGTTNDFPCVGDYDGDGKADLTAVRVEAGQRVWYIRNSSTGAMRREIFGSSVTDGVFFFAPFDMDGDSKQDIAVNRIVANQRQFHYLRSSDGQYVQTTWGLTTDTALFGDFDGDGKTDLVARRNVGGTFEWNILQSSDAAWNRIYWGLSTDQLVEDPNADAFYKSLVQSD